jgi:CelD/BcsL family acetyltransferase involved in cellulose biosynthesis
VPVDQLAPTHLLDPGVARRWEAAWERDPEATLFHHPLWTEVSVSGDVEPLVVTGGDSVLAVRVGPDRVLRFLTDHNVTDIASPIGDPGDAVALVDALGALAGWTSADLDGFIGSRWLEPLRDAAAARGWQVAAEDVSTSPWIRLPGSFEEYLAGIESKQRHEVRRKARRLERELAPWLSRVSDAATLDADVDAFIAMHRLAEGDKGTFMTGEHEALFRRVASATLARGWLRLSWIETLDGDRLAAVWSFALRGRWLVWNSAFDPVHRELSTGMIAIAEAIRLACEERCSIFDLLRGDEPYKYRFGAVDAPVRVLRFSREVA